MLDKTVPRESTAPFDVGLPNANIDLVFVLFGADRPMRQRKVMRFVAFAGDIGATPVVLVTKADTVDPYLLAILPSVSPRTTTWTTSGSPSPPGMTRT